MSFWGTTAYTYTANPTENVHREVTCTYSRNGTHFQCQPEAHVVHNGVQRQLKMQNQLKRHAKPAEYACRSRERHAFNFQLGMRAVSAGSACRSIERHARRASSFPFSFPFFPLFPFSFPFSRSFTHSLIHSFV